MHAAEVLDHKQDLMVRMEDPMVRRIWSSQVALDSRESYESGHRGQDGITYSAATEREHSATGAANILNLWHTLPDAEAYHVSPDMAQLVLYAASQLNDTDKIDRTILPTRSGIARFEGGLPFTDVRGKHMRVSWIAWGPVLANFRQVGRAYDDPGEPQEVTALWMWNDHREEPDDIFYDMKAVHEAEGNWETAERHLGRWGFIGSEVMIDNARVGPAWADPGERKREKVIASGDVPQNFTNAIRLAHAFFLLLGQTVTQSGEANLDRPRRKRATRAGIPARVTIIHLRNLETRREPGESMVDWSHRWLVRGHWHWFHCASDHPLAQEVELGKWMCRRWLAPYVKGPEDKPLVITDKVYALHR